VHDLRGLKVLAAKGKLKKRFLNRTSRDLDLEFGIGCVNLIASNPQNSSAGETRILSTNNPYAFNPLDIRQEDPSDHPDFGRVLRALSETRPWVRMLGIVLIITPVLLFFGGAWMSPGIRRFGGIRSGGFFALLMFGSWGISLVGYLLIGIQLLGYASLIHKTEVSLNMNAVAAAVEKQQTLWKYAALFVITTLLLSSLPMLIVLVQIALR
jgi:hypothetical protein